MKRLPTIHRMDRRSTFKNYMLPGIYHVTVKATETLRSPFGVVVGSIDKPDGDADAPRVALSPVGEMVERELMNSIARHYPMVEVQDHVVMPEHLHFIVVVKRRIVNRQGRAAHLGQVIAGFKLGCNHQWWKMTGQQLMRPEAAEEAAGSPAAQAPGTGAGRFRRQGAHHIATLPSLFQEGYCDVMPVDAEQLATQRAYIKGNPRSRLMRTTNRDWLQPRRGGIDTALTTAALRGYLQRECAPSQFSAERFALIEGRLLQEKKPGGGTAGNMIACDTYGDRRLLERRMLPVVCHRKDEMRRTQQLTRCLEEAERGAVLVSPRIAKGEQAIIDAAVDHGFAVIHIADNGFPEVYHPSTERISRCAEGRLLIVTPWEYHYRRSDEGISLMECKTMNCLAQAICRLRDDWWKQEGTKN